MLFVAAKRSDNVRIAKAAEKYILKSYDKAAWSTVQRFFLQFDETHQTMVNTSFLSEFDEGSLQHFATCLRFYRSIEEKVSAKGLDLDFVWTDTLRKRKVKDQSFVFEKVNMMYDLGSVYSYLGSVGDFTTPEGKKSAMNRFLMAAGCFDKARDWSRELPRCDCIDLSQEHCSYTIYLMIAQAYICMYEFVDKSTYNKINIGKVANAVSKNFQYANELTLRTPLVQNYPKDHVAFLEFQANIYRAYAHYWTALGDKEAAEAKGSGFGQSVSRLRLARSYADQAVRIRYVGGAALDKARTFFDQVSRAVKEAEDTNMNVYMDSIPNPNDLRKIEDLTMLNPKFPPGVDIEAKIEGDECLNVLIPKEVRAVMNQYKEKLMEIVHSENASAAEIRSQLESALSTMNLPQKLDALASSEPGIPDDVWQRVQEVNARGGMLQVEKMMESLNVMNSSNLHLMEDVERMIKQEEDDDASHRTMFGPRWNRTLSQAGNASLKQDLFKFKEKTAQATAVDRAIVENFQSAQVSLQLTKKSKEELSQMIPRASATVDTTAEPVVQLKAGLAEYQAVQKQLQDELIVLQTMTDSDNIVGEIMQLYTTHAPMEPLIARELEKYNEIKGRIGTLKSQEMEVIGKIRISDRSFEQFTNSVRTNSERMEFLQALSIGCAKFTELVNQLSQGMNFYKQLGQLIGQLQQRVSDFIIARNLEKNDLVMRLTQGSVPPGGYSQGPGQYAPQYYPRGYK